MLDDSAREVRSVEKSADDVHVKRFPTTLLVKSKPRPRNTFEKPRNAVNAA